MWDFLVSGVSPCHAEDEYGAGNFWLQLHPQPSYFHMDYSGTYAMKPLTDGGVVDSMLKVYGA